jgi:hypothetical protein
MVNDVTPPIEVNDGTMIGTVGTLLRYLVTSVGGYALGKGWIDNELLQILTGLVTVGLPLAYGVYKNYVHKTQLLVTAEAAPNSVAVVK